MLNIASFGKRIQLIMDHYNLSASTFADSLAVGRSSISHILSGRNKPSLDFVLKIAKVYPETNLYWLLEGKGSFPTLAKEISSIKKSAPEVSPISNQMDTPKGISSQQDLFSKYTSEAQSTVSSSSHRSTKKSIIPTNDVRYKEINRIIIFYADGSFESYQN